MNTRLVRFGLVTMSATAALFLVSIHAAQGQTGAPADKERPCIGCSVDGKTTPRTADGHPDLNGFWNNQAGVGGNIAGRSADGSVLFDFGGAQLGPDGKTLSSTPGSGYGTPNLKLSEPSYKPEYDAKVKAIADSQYGASTPDDPQFDCKPLGVPRGAFGTMHIVETPQVVAVLYEGAPGPTYRLIYTDGRPHPKDLDTTYWGHSIGHWDGDTLVVDVVGLNDETWLGGGMGGPKYALLHSEMEHVTERWTRNGDMLNYEAVVEDPVMFTKPWVVTPKRMQHARAGDDIIEAICAPNDKEHIVKPTENDKFICNYCTDKTAK